MFAFFFVVPFFVINLRNLSVEMKNQYLLYAFEADQMTAYSIFCLYDSSTSESLTVLAFILPCILKHHNRPTDGHSIVGFISMDRSLFFKQLN